MPIGESSAFDHYVTFRYRPRTRKRHPDAGDLSSDVGRYARREPAMGVANGLSPAETIGGGIIRHVTSSSRRLTRPRRAERREAEPDRRRRHNIPLLVSGLFRI